MTATRHPHRACWCGARDFLLDVSVHCLASTGSTGGVVTANLSPLDTATTPVAGSVPDERISRASRRVSGLPESFAPGWSAWSRSLFITAGETLPRCSARDRGLSPMLARHQQFVAK